MGNFENAKVLVKEGWLQGYTEDNLKNSGSMYGFD